MADKLVLDLETQRDFNEVEGRKPELLGVSVAGVYSYDSNRYDAYLEGDLGAFAGRLRAADLLIGFNIRRFDLAVLQPYVPFPVTTLPVLDIMEDLAKELGHRVSLESVAQATLGRGKSGHGLDALRWFKQGRFDLITKYCLDDVRLTKEVYDYGQRHGRLFVTGRFNPDKLTVSVFWPDRRQSVDAIAKVLAEAQGKRLQVEIDYVAQRAAAGESPRCRRRVDVYHIRDPYFEGYCHLRGDVRQFRIDRVLEVKPVWQRYTIPEHFVPTTASPE